MDYKKLWNLSRNELKKTTNAAQRLEAAQAYAKDFKDCEVSTGRKNLGDVINDAANIFSVSFDDYNRIFEALKRSTLNN